MNSAYPCSICQEGGHKASKCPELHHPEKASGGGGGGHDHDDDEKVAPVTFTYFGTLMVQIPTI
jgi:hypothetical protein